MLDSHTVLLSQLFEQYILQLSFEQVGSKENFMNFYAPLTVFL